MEKIKAKKINVIAFLLISALICCFTAAVMSRKPTNEVYAAEVVIENWSQGNGALVGDTLDVPQSVRLEIEDGVLVNAESGAIIFPNGVSKSLGPKLLDVAGQYTLVYYATHEGKMVKGEKAFMVSDLKYRLSGAASTAEFKTADNLKYAKLLGNKKADGIEISLAKGETFRYNQPINIYDVAGKNNGWVDISLAYPVMDTSLWSNDIILSDNDGLPLQAWGERLGNFFVIKLIDCSDENNTIEFYIWSNQQKNVGNRYCQSAVSVNGGKYCWIEAASQSSANAVIDGKYYMAHGNARYIGGGGVATMFNTIDQFRSNCHDSFRLNMDSGEVWYDSTIVGNQIITDIYEDQIYENPFKGFTTGDVYVEYSFVNSWTDEPMYLYIKSILGLEGEVLKDGIATDTSKPLVDINITYTDASRKSINIAYGEEFVLPIANVYDSSGNTSLKTALYYDYFTDNPKVAYFKDGRFTPDKKGKIYTVIYLAEDSFGNKNVDADGKCTDYVNMIVVNDDIFTYEEKQVTTLSAGSVNTLPNIIATSLNGNEKLNVFVYEPNGDKVDITSDFDGTGFLFIPGFIGEYTVEYLFSDNVYSKSFTYKATSVESGNVLFDKKIALPSILIKNAVYELDTYYGLQATADGFKQQEAKLLVAYDGGEFSEIQDIKNFKIAGDSYLRIKANLKGVETEAYTCQIVDVNFTESPSVNNGAKIYENYFVGAQSVLVGKSCFSFGFNGSQPVDLRYAMPLPYSSFIFEFSVPESSSSIKSFDIILKGISGIEEGYVVTYAKSDMSGRVFIKVANIDGTKIYNSNHFMGSFFGGHTLKISNKVITLDEGIVTRVDAVSAKYFNLSIGTSQNAGDFSLDISMLNGTSLSEYVYEKPDNLVWENLQYTPEIGKEFILPEFIISSTFYPVRLSELTVSLVDGSGVPIVDENGNKMENLKVSEGRISFIPKNAGIYYLKAKYADRQIDSSYILTVRDSLAPVTEFEDGSNSSTVVKIKEGDTHEIKNFNITDNVTAKEKLIVKIAVIDSSGAVVAWIEPDCTFDETGLKITSWGKSSYRFTKTGLYKVMILAQDESKNMSRTYYNVQVEEK